MKGRVALAAVLLVTGGLTVFYGSRTDPAERNNAGNWFYQQGEYGLAIRAYHAAQVNAPDEPAAYYNLAGPLADTGQLRRAAETLEQAVATADEPLTLWIYYSLGDVYFQMARYAEAVDAYRYVLERDPADENARYNYELALLRRVPTPTPTPQEQQTDPEEEQADSTPTHRPAGQDGPTPTPSPQPDSPPDENATPVSGVSGSIEGSMTSTPIPATSGPLTIEDVERRLDAIQESQQTLREFLLRAATPSRPNTRDW